MQFRGLLEIHLLASGGWSWLLVLILKLLHGQASTTMPTAMYTKENMWMARSTVKVKADAPLAPSPSLPPPPPPLPLSMYTQ
jgi:hypothetical protein